MVLFNILFDRRQINLLNLNIIIYAEQHVFGIYED